MRPVIERILKKINVTTSGCWESGYSVQSNGYTQIQLKHKTGSVHRIMYNFYHGELVKGLQINHTCKNKICCNPLHLEQVTPRENTNYSRTEMMKAISKRIEHNSQKTQCPYGHPYSGDNLYLGYRSRHCRTCMKNGRIKRKNKRNT